MGITNLLPFLRKHAPKAITKAPSLESLKNKSIAIDLAILIRKVLYGSVDEYCETLVQMDTNLKENLITPIWVFDGVDSAQDKKEERHDRQKKRMRGEEIAEEQWEMLAKEKELIMRGDAVKRAKTEMEAAKQALISSPTSETRLLYDHAVTVHQRIVDLESQPSMMAKAQRLAEIDAVREKQDQVVVIDYDKIKEEFRRHDITFVIAKGEAERCCAWLAHTKKVDIVASDDSDAIAHGSPMILRNLGPSLATLKMELWDFSVVLTSLKLSYPSFVEFCLLCGCDFCDNIQGLGPVAAYELIDFYGAIDKAMASPLFDKWKKVDNFASVQERWDRARKRLFLTAEMGEAETI